MISNDIKIKGAKVLNLGITFKENCSDVRNTKAVGVIKALEDYGIKVITYDPWANPDEIKHQYNITSYNSLTNSHAKVLEEVFPKKTDTEALEIDKRKFDAIVLTVAHQEFLDLKLKQYLKVEGIIYDVKGVLPHNSFNKRL